MRAGSCARVFCLQWVAECVRACVRVPVSVCVCVCVCACALVWVVCVQVRQGAFVGTRACIRLVGGLPVMVSDFVCVAFYEAPASFFGRHASPGL